MYAVSLYPDTVGVVELDSFVDEPLCGGCAKAEDDFWVQECHLLAQKWQARLVFRVQRRAKFVVLHFTTAVI